MILSASKKGEFRKANLDSPFTMKVGDVCVQDGNTIHFIRNNVVIASRQIVGQAVAAPIAAANPESVNSVVFFWRAPMSGVVATALPPRIDSATGIVTFPFTDGQDVQYPSITEAITQTDFIDTDNTLAKQMLIRMMCKRSPDGTNLHQLVGATCTIDALANQIVSVAID